MPQAKPMQDWTFTEFVLDEVKDERDRQEQKWGEQNHDLFRFLAILMEEVGEASQSAVKSYLESKTPEESEMHLRNYRKELVQVAAMAVQMIESVDRNELRHMGEMSDNPTEVWNGVL